ncbi:ABC transporter ATP-binding protein [Saccharopolyspora gloriosae]|uniref:ABC-2 type transport system ATP-binding protein n=1 Tax=Saccharopolyspora gloriosae TaxID=455344 RepID=A0A840NCJ0_9PSEU|nr:ABC-2 type transport system ATP-binding protein [Saccharopolyspora gloriosae]
MRAEGLGKRYRRGWALRECSFRLPPNRIVALVGPNGAGKSTLLGLLTGLLAPSEGVAEVFGRRPSGSAAPADVAYLAQQKPLYPGLTVRETLRLGARMNTTWDQDRAERLVREAAVPFEAKIGTLSGGQRTRVALALALGKRPALLLLDEPMADLDPLARQATLRTLQDEARRHPITIVLSSHVLSDLTDVCDHLLLMSAGAVRLDGSVADLVAGHRVLRGPGAAPDPVRRAEIIDEVRSPRERFLLARAGGPVTAPGWRQERPRLEDIALAHMRGADNSEVAA